MASGRMEFHAQTTMTHANFTFVLPNDVEMGEVKDLSHYDRETKNIILLHGLTVGVYGRQGTVVVKGSRKSGHCTSHRLLAVKFRSLTVELVVH